MILNYKNGKVERTIEFKDDIFCYDVALNENDEIIISYKTVNMDVEEYNEERVDYYIGKVFNENSIKALDKYNGFLYRPSKFSKPSADLFIHIKKIITMKLKVE